MRRATTQRPMEGDPHADYTRSLIKPAEVLEAVGEAVAKPLGLEAVVLIEAQGGRPRSFSWRAEHANAKGNRAR